MTDQSIPYIFLIASLILGGAFLMIRLYKYRSRRREVINLNLKNQQIINAYLKISEAAPDDSQRPDVFQYEEDVTPPKRNVRKKILESVTPMGALPEMSEDNLSL